MLWGRGGRVGVDGEGEDRNAHVKAMAFTYGAVSSGSSEASSNFSSSRQLAMVEGPGAK